MAQRAAERLANPSAWDPAVPSGQIPPYVKPTRQGRHARHLVKWLRRHEPQLSTDLDDSGVQFENNHSERILQPAVIVRKNSNANGSDSGGGDRAVLMSVFSTLKQRGHNLVSTIIEAVRTSLKTGQLPPLPGPTTVDG